MSRPVGSALRARLASLANLTSTGKPACADGTSEPWTVSRLRLGSASLSVGAPSEEGLSEEGLSEEGLSEEELSEEELSEEELSEEELSEEELSEEELSEEELSEEELSEEELSEEGPPGGASNAGAPAMPTALDAPPAPAPTAVTAASGMSALAMLSFSLESPLELAGGSGTSAVQGFVSHRIEASPIPS